MKITRAKVLLAAAALSGSLGVGVLVSAMPASAATVSVAGCPASTGSTDTATISVQLDDTLLQPGVVIPLHDRTGVQADGFYNGITFNPTLPADAMSAPVCGVQKTAAGTLSYSWLYCTEEPKNVCGTEGFTQSSNVAGTLTAIQKARLAYIIDHPLRDLANEPVDNSTTRARGQRQRLVWCVTNGLAANAPAPAYLGGESALNCPNWPAIDPTLNLTPAIAVTAAPGTTTPGSPVTFTVSTNVSPLAVTSTGLDAVTLCAGAPAGVTYVAGQLTIPNPTAGVQVPLCGVRAAAGNGTLTAAIAAHTVSTLEFWQRPTNNGGCQGMLTTQLQLDAPGGTASASAVWQDVLDTTTVAPTTTTTIGTTTTTDPTPSTTGPQVLETTIPNTLPRTGVSQERGTLTAGALFLMLGVGLLMAGRREAARD